MKKNRLLGFVVVSTSALLAFASCGSSDEVEPGGTGGSTGTGGSSGSTSTGGSTGKGGSSAGESAADDVPAILVGYGPRGAGDTPRRRRRGQAATSTGTATGSSSGTANGESTSAPAADETSTTEPTSPAGAPLAKPPVRWVARQLGVDLAAIAPGSGPGGTITRADVTRAAEGRTGPTAEQPRSAPPAVTPAVAREIPLQGIRARIAERMTVSHASIPDAGCAVEVDCSQLFAIRDAVRAQTPARDGADAITPFSLILRLLVAALVEHPILNSRLDTDAGVIRVHDTIHLGIGASTDRGLLVPVVRNAERLTTVALALEVRRLADGARTGTLAPAELIGSTFTVSNFGSFGIDDGYPVINHPEVAILGVGAIRPRPVVVEGAVVARRTARVTCSFDHRVCDGADVGGFLARLRALIESPGLLLLDV